MTKKPKPKFIAVGKTVTWIGNRGHKYVGRVDGSDTKVNGVWVAVNIASRGQNRQIVQVQQSRLTVVR